MNPHLSYWLAAHHLQISARKMLACLTRVSTIEQFFHASHEELLQMGFKNTEAIRNFDFRHLEIDFQWASMPNHYILSLHDDDYPSLLTEIYNPPLILYVQGDKNALKQSQLAMVGARCATPFGLQNAKNFAFKLVQKGLAITSGLALGIDSASHRGALQASGITIGVAGTGLKHIYPRSNRVLVEAILDHGGCVISEFSLDTAPIARNFPWRNRIIAGMSRGVLVIEAALKSGSLITAYYAIEQGKEVFAIPGSIHQPLAKGCHLLLKQGAKLVETVEDVLEELGAFNSFLAQEAPKIDLKISDRDRAVFAHIGYETTPIDVILLRAGLTKPEVSSILLALELKGYIQSVVGGYIRSEG